MLLSSKTKCPNIFDHLELLFRTISLDTSPGFGLLAVAAVSFEAVRTSPHVLLLAQFEYHLNC